MSSFNLYEREANIVATRLTEQLRDPKEWVASGEKVWFQIEYADNGVGEVQLALSWARFCPKEGVIRFWGSTLGGCYGVAILCWGYVFSGGKEVGKGKIRLASVSAFDDMPVA